MPANQRVGVVTIAEQIKGEEVNVLKNNKLLALAEEKGRVQMNCGGDDCEWDVRVRRGRFAPWEDNDPGSFPRIDRHIKAKVPWRAYRATEGLGILEKLKNKGPSARTEIVSKIAEWLLDDARFDFAAEFLVDGEDAANGSRIHGIKTCCRFTGSGAFLTPSGSYGGKSIELGVAAGGSVISGTYPTGQFDIEYDAFSPLGVNGDHASWLTEAGGSSTARAYFLACRAGLIHNMNTRGASQGRVDVMMTNAERYRSMLGVLDEKERILIQKGAATSALTRLGFGGDVTNFDGTDFTFDSNVDVYDTWGLKYDQMEIRSLQGQLFMPGEEFELERLADLYSLLFAGNVTWNPRGFLYVKKTT